MLRLVHAQLVNAEAARTAGERFKEFEAFNHLGLYFEQSGMLPLAAYHYNRCLSIAEAIDWLDGCMASNLALGLGAPIDSARITTWHALPPTPAENVLTGTAVGCCLLRSQLW